MAEWLTEAWLGLFDAQIRVRATRDPAFTSAAAKLLTEVRERRAAETYGPLERLRDVVDEGIGLQPVLEFDELLSLIEKRLSDDRTRIATLEAALRECIDLDNGLLRLGGDIEKSSGEGVDWDHVAIGAADGILTRARAALKGGAP